MKLHASIQASCMFQTFPSCSPSVALQGTRSVTEEWYGSRMTAEAYLEHLARSLVHGARCLRFSNLGTKYRDTLRIHAVSVEATNGKPST
jgi:hypothetical protein